MKIEIHLSAYVFPMLLAFFKSLGNENLVQWWRAISKRHFSYNKVAKRSVADATLAIDLYWLVGLWKEPVFTVKQALYLFHYYCVRPAWHVFYVPWKLAYILTLGRLWGLWSAYYQTHKGRLFTNKPVLLSSIPPHDHPSGYVGPCYCDACITRQEWESATSIVEMGYDNISWANEYVTKYPGGEGLPECEFEHSFERVLAQMIADGHAKLEPGGTKATLKWDEFKTA